MYTGKRLSVFSRPTGLASGCSTNTAVLRSFIRSIGHDQNYGVDQGLNNITDGFCMRMCKLFDVTFDHIVRICKFYHKWQNRAFLFSLFETN